MNQSHCSQKGFAALELFVAIAIVSIIVIASIPRFVSLKDVSNLVLMEKVYSDVNVALGLVSTQARVLGLDDGRNKIDVGLAEVELLNGFPLSTNENELEKVMPKSYKGIEYRAFPVVSKVVVYPAKLNKRVQIGGFILTEFKCALVYENTDNGSYVNFLNKEGC